MLLNLAYMQKK